MQFFKLSKYLIVSFALLAACSNGEMQKNTGPDCSGGRGACSSHDGVNCSAGADSDGSAICNDGWKNSSVDYCAVCNDE